MTTWRQSRRQFLLMLPAGLLGSRGLNTTGAAQPATPVASGPPAGLLVANATGPNGALLHKNIIISAPDGTHRHDISSDQLLALYPAPDSERAIVTTINSAVFVLDAASTKLLLVAIPADVATTLIVLAMSPHWALLGTTHGQATYLVNLRTGAVSTLPALTDQNLAHPIGRIAPDEQTAFLVAGNGLWLIPIAHPAQRRQIVGDVLVTHASFSDDGRWAVYVATGLHDGVWSLVVVRADGTDQTIVSADQGAAYGAFVPGSHEQELIVQRVGEVVQLTLANHQERPLLRTDAEEVPAGVWFSPSGQHLILRTVTPKSSAGGNRWTWLELASGNATPLTALNDLSIPELGTNRRWILATNISVSNPDNAGALLDSLDTETGTTRLLLKAAAKTIYVASGPYRPQTADGRFRFIQTLGMDNPIETLLLADAATGTVREVASGVQLGAALSPDGHWLAVSTITKPGRSSPVQSRIVALDGSATRPLGGGFVMGWLASPSMP